MTVATARKTRFDTATFEQVLFYFDAPQIILFDTGRKSKIIAVAIDSVSKRSFFGARVSFNQFTDYLNERFDLRYLIGNPDKNIWYEFDEIDYDGRTKFERVDLTKERVDKYLPAHGFFARDHTEEYEALIIPDLDVQRFKVDGKWNMREFAKMHSQISDLYAFSRSIELYTDDTASVQQKREVTQSFVKPWQGGGSYHAFFKSLAKAGGRDYQPDIRAIQWASPGHVDITGSQEAFDRLISILKHYGKNHKKIVDSYDHLWCYLQETKLLKSNTLKLDRNSDVAKEVNSRAQQLSAILKIVGYRTVKSMAGNDPVVAAKVLLAAQRRLGRLYEFFSEGRLAVSGERIA